MLMLRILKKMKMKMVSLKRFQLMEMVMVTEMKMEIVVLMVLVTKPELTDRQKKQLENVDIKKQKKFMDGEISKKRSF